MPLESFRNGIAKIVYKPYESGYAPSHEGGHTLKPVGTVSTYEMATNESLPDSGGHYYDEDSGGFVGVARRNVGKAKSAITSGEVGATAVATAIGFAVGSWFMGTLGGN